MRAFARRPVKTPATKLSSRKLATIALVFGLLLAAPAGAAPRVLVWLPREAASLQPQVARAFSWAESAVVLGPDTVAKVFPPSQDSRAQAEDADRLEKLLRAAESDFVALHFDKAALSLSGCDALLERLPPSLARETAFVRLSLLQGRIELARGNARASTEAFVRAAEAAVSVELDEAEYPPQVRAAFKAAREQVKARPTRTATISSEPADAEIEVNGRLAGRTPAQVKLPPGRCFFSVARPGFHPHLAACPTEDQVAVKLESATHDGVRDQLRERLATDPAWFLDPSQLDNLASEEQARWIVALERDRAGGLKVLAYSVAEHALKPIEPSRFTDGEIDKLSAAVQGLVDVAQKVEAQVVQTAAGAPGIEARASDPSLGTAAVFMRRTGSPAYLRLGLSPLGPGRFLSALPLALSKDGGWDVEYYVEAYDAGGVVACRAGEATAPLSFRQATMVAPPPPVAWYNRWYVWTVVGVLAAGAAGTGIYFGTRSNDISVLFGGHR